MKESIFKNLKLNFLITLLIGVLNFLVNKYFSKYMGLNQLGLMKLFTQMIAYLSIVELGLGSASSYALYKPLKENNIEKISLIISTIDYFYKKIAIIIFVLGIVLGFLLPFIVENNFINIKIYWYLYVFNTALGYMFVKYTVLFTANQEYGFVRRIQGIGKILSQVVQIIVIIYYKSFSLFIIIMICENIYNYYFYLKHYKKFYSYIKSIDKKDKNIVKDMKNLFWHKIGEMVVHNTDYIILSKYISIGIVGIYSSYIMIYQMIVTIMNVITAVINPKIGLYITSNSNENNYKYWKLLQIIYNWLSCICIICMYKLIYPFIILWMGREFLVDKITIVLIILNLYINLNKIVTDIFKFNYGFFSDTYAPILESILNLFFSLILVTKIGLNGVIIGTLISNIIIIFFLKPILVFIKCFNKSWKIYLKDTLKLTILVIVSILVTNLVLNIINIDFDLIVTWKDLIIKAIYLLIISIICVSLTFLLEKNFRNILKDTLQFNK